MKEHFGGFYSPSSAEFEKMWKEGLIVLDTNVLLNLYRIPEAAREELLTVLENFKDRIWIPHQVALEFQKRRLKVIFLERKRIEDMLSLAESTVEKLKESVESLQIERHGVGLQPTPILDALAATNEKLIEAITAVQKSQLDVASSDPVRDRLDVILSGRIGPGPSSQEELDQLTIDAEKRFDESIPPGFKDSKKAESEDPIFIHDHLKYHRQHGDLILWRQLISHVKDAPHKAVIFVTDDNKEDWWWKSNGRTIGAHPELVREITRLTPVNLFWIYSYANFLTHAKSYTDVTISDASVDEVREASQIMNLSVKNARSEDSFLRNNNLRARGDKLERGVVKWLRTKYDFAESSGTFPDIVAEDMDGTLIGFEVKGIRLQSALRSAELINSILRGFLEMKGGKFSKFWLILVFDSSASLTTASEARRNRLRFEFSKVVKEYPISGIIIGILNEDDEFEPEFEILNGGSDVFD